jgi:hypothetical protein
MTSFGKLATIGVAFCAGLPLILFANTHTCRFV